MDKIITQFPKIGDKTKYYLIKTYNGKYYHHYLRKGVVGLYSLQFNKQKEIITSNKNYLKAFKIFTSLIQVGDVVLIPTYHNLSLSIGIIESNIYFDNQLIYRKVKWLRTIEAKNLAYIHRYLHLVPLVISVDPLKDDIDRHTYQHFLKNNFYHIVLKVTQKESILCKSLYGLYDLFLSACNEPRLNIKMTVQSPGLIELITDNLDVVIAVIKVIQIIKYLREKKLKSGIIAEKYYQYEVDKLELEVPKIGNDCS